MTAPPPLLSVAEAQSRILADIACAPEAEDLTVGAALARFSAQAIQAPGPLPPFASSAVDGYALGAAEPGEHRVIGAALAGHPYAGGPLAPGECTRILTGAAVPAGACAIVMQEDVTHSGETVFIGAPPREGDHIRPAGGDLRAGEALLSEGDQLHAGRCALLEAAGVASVRVRRRIRVACFSTGDELRPPGSVLAAGQIFESNRRLLFGLLDEPWLECLDLGIVPDEPDRLRAALAEAASQADVVLTTGGVSVGDTDYMTGLVEAMGRLDFWRVAVKPGKPLAVGSIGKARYFGLPGNPVSAAVTALLFVRPALVAMAGGRFPLPRHFSASLGAEISRRPGREEYVRARLDREAGPGGLPLVHPASGQGSHQLSGLAASDCLIRLPADVEHLPEGSMVRVLALPWLG